MTDTKPPSAEAPLSDGLKNILHLLSLSDTDGPLVQEIRSFAEQRAAGARRVALEEAMKIAKGGADLVRGNDIKFVPASDYAADLAMDIFDGIRALADQAHKAPR